MASGKPVIPDWEVVVRGSDGTEYLLVGFFINDKDEIDVLIGVAGEEYVSAVRLVLESTIRALDSAGSWIGGSDLEATNQARKSEGGELPFE